MLQGPGNVISGNRNEGIRIVGTNNGATGNVIQGNIIGLAINGTAPLGNLLVILHRRVANLVGLRRLTVPPARSGGVDMEGDNDADEDLREEGATEGEGPPVPAATRGLGWVLASAAAGVVVGMLLGPLAASVPILPMLWGPTPSLSRGALVGGIAGAAVGVFIWAFFPYRGGRGPDEPPQS